MVNKYTFYFIFLSKQLWTKKYKRQLFLSESVKKCRSFDWGIVASSFSDQNSSHNVYRILSPYWKKQTTSHYGNTGYGVFKFLPKNQQTQRKLLNFEFWINGELSKSAKPKFYFQSQFSLSKIIRMFLIFFSLKSTSLLLAFFDKTNF